MYIMNSHRKIFYPFNTLDYNDKRGAEIEFQYVYLMQNEMKVNNNVNRF